MSVGIWKKQTNVYIFQIVHSLFIKSSLVDIGLKKENDGGQKGDRGYG